MKRLCVFVAFLLFIFFAPPIAALSEVDLQKQIDEFQSKVTQLQGQASSLLKEISLKNSQISLAQLKISSTKNSIDKLSKEINELTDQIDTLEVLKTKRLELARHRAPEVYKRKNMSLVGFLLLGQNFSDVLTRIKYLSRVQEVDAQLYKQLQLTQTNYNERKDLREEKRVAQEKLKKQLEDQNRELDRQKKEKETLLSQTKNDEATYQKLLAQAQAQLASFASFVDAQGASLLGSQTFCNDWGCYYNQRDSQWGNILINGQGSGCKGPCNVLRVGCLVTSVAMVASHLGRKDILPIDVAISGPENFSVGTALLRKGSISVKGVNINRTTIASSLNPDLVKDGPVIVGVYHGQFGTHFVVIKSYSNGNYIMNDPYEAGGHDISFTSRYSLGSVFSVDRVSI